MMGGERSARRRSLFGLSSLLRRCPAPASARPRRERMSPGEVFYVILLIAVLWWGYNMLRPYL